MEDNQMWQELRTSWGQYKETIESWVRAVDGSRRDEEVDALLHEVIHSHNYWSQRLGDVIQKTHHH